MAFQTLQFLTIMQDASPNTYKVEWLMDLIVYSYLTRGPPNGIVHFQNFATTEIDVPDPFLISIHAAVAHVLHISGAGPIIDWFLDRFPADCASILQPPDALVLRMALLSLSHGSVSRLR